MTTETTFQLDPTFRASLSRYLSTEVIDALPERRAFNKATRHLNTLRVALSSYLPKYIADEEALLTTEHSDLRMGTFMFADVSGFTALSEKLQRATGVEGAEIMTQIINDFFTTMLEILAKSDGQMLKFAGDALLTFFPVTAEESDRPDLVVAAKAIRTGLRMQRAMREQFQPIQHPLLDKLFGDHQLELKMSIGIASGQLFEALVGNQSQRDHMIMGKLPGEADAAEAAGVRDDVIINDELKRALGDQFRYKPADGDPTYWQVIDDFGEDLGDYEVTSIVSRRKTSFSSSLLAIASDVDPLQELRNLMTQVDNYARFVAAEVVNKLALEGDRVEPQNRPAVVIFGYFSGISDMLDAWGEGELRRITNILNRYYSGIQQTIAAYGGALTRSDPYRVGSKLLITFGAPIAHPDDAFRAVATALAMLRWTEQFNAQLHTELPQRLRRESYLQFRAGVAMGQAFAGEVGWKQRREYTVMGDDVNLAARLMSKAAMGEVWVSERVYYRVEDYFITEALPPMQMKGKSEPTHAYRVLGMNPAITDAPRMSSTKFVGRDELLLTLHFSLEQARAKRRRLIALVGDTGIGKTRVAHQLLQEAKSKGFITAWATCLTMDDARTTWAAVVGQLLDVPNDRARQEQYDYFLDALDTYALDEFYEPLSLLLFGAVLHEDQLQVPIDERLQSEGETLAALIQTIGVAVIEVLKRCADVAPVLVVLDDLHKANPFAIQILQQVYEQIKRGRILIVATYEPSPTIALELNETLLDDLSEYDIMRIACGTLHVPELSDVLEMALWGHTRGRPLYAEAMLQLWQERDMIALQDGVADLNAQYNPQLLPDSLRTLLISQIDRLPNVQQRVMQAAAVLNAIHPTFTAEMIAYLCRLDEAEVIQHLNTLEQKRLLLSEGTEWRMRYVVGQVAIYESLTRLQRQNLHLAATDYWQRSSEAGRYWFEIVNHMIKAGQLTKALLLVEKIAAEAESIGDIEAALAFYEQALSLFPNDRSLQSQISRLMQHAAQLIQQQAHAEAKLEPQTITGVIQKLLTAEMPAVEADPDPTIHDADDWAAALKRKLDATKKKK